MLLLWLFACTGTGGVVLDDAPSDDSDQPADDTASGEHLIELSINEVMADNATSLLDDEGMAPDWIEVYNASAFDVDLDGFGLTDDFEEPLKAVIGAVVVPAGEFVLLYADQGSGPDHLGFKLDATGEQLGLYTPDGQAIDLLEFGTQVQDMALARAQDGVEGDWIYVYGGTPGESNED